MKDRPKVLHGQTYKVKTGYGNLYVVVNEMDEGDPVELFAVIGKSGQSTTAKTEAIGRLVTLCLEEGVPVESVVNQLKGIAGELPMPDGKEVYKSIPDAIANVLHYMYLSGKAASFPKTALIPPDGLTKGRTAFYKCPKCHTEFGSTTVITRCPNCGSVDTEFLETQDEKHE